MNVVSSTPSSRTTVVPIDDPKQKPAQMSDPNLLSNIASDRIDRRRVRYPHCIVWTPIPCLTWLLPFVGHMGIARTDGIIRDFAGPYYVSVRTKQCLKSS
jgi:hypothetical protein